MIINSQSKYGDIIELKGRREMERQALKDTIPKGHSRSSREIWWDLLRPHTLTAAFIPVSIGTALALQQGKINISLFFAMLVASILIQAATNMFNEYYDFKRGLDNEESVGIGGAIVRDGIHPNTVLLVAICFFGVAAILGIYICMNSSWWIALIGIICMAAGYFYTGGPLPIAYTPFGEIVAGFFMGFLIIMLSNFIQTGVLSKEGILLSIPISILVGAILMANNIRDLDGDKENGRKTLAILLGRENAVKCLALMFIISYAWILFLTIFGGFTPWVLIIFLSVPKALKATKGFIGKTIPLQMMPAMKATAQTNTLFGFLLIVGILINNWL